MTGVIVLARLGSTTTVQDGGRTGVARLGVPRSGAMDATSHRLAARLAGWAPDRCGEAAALEVGWDGAALAAHDAPLTLSVAGPGAAVTVDGVSHPAPCVVVLAPGEVAVVRTTQLWAYVVPDGGVALPAVLGARSRHTRSGLGPALVEGQQVPLLPPLASAAGPGCRPVLPAASGPLALLPGPQWHLLAPDERDLLTHGTFRTTSAQDRMGHRLDGPPVRLHAGHDIVSDAVVPGAVQLPGDGRPFVLTADAQTTGGYPKPAVLAATALDRFVQLRPGTSLRFAWSDVAAARRSLLAGRAAVERVVAAPGRPPGAMLAVRNIVGGVTDGDAS